MSDVISQYGFLLLIMACIFGFFMAWGVGANDVANAMGTSVGAQAITIKQAIIIAMVFEFTGCRRRLYRIGDGICMVKTCHRVIKSDGTIGGYSGPGGKKTKIKLLKMEGYTFKNL